jgi:hypothetical protein
MSDIGSHFIKAKKEKYYIMEDTSQNQENKWLQTSINGSPV